MLVTPTRVSVIVPVYRDARRLGLCLDALSRQSYPSEFVETIVVDNGDDPELVSLAEHFPHVRFEREPAPGSYVARNRGVALAKGELIAFTDADCIPARRWIEAGVAALAEQPDAGVVGGPMRMISERPQLSAFDLYDVVCSLPQRAFVERHGFAATGNAFTRRSVIDAVGPFLPWLKSGGDREWCARVRDAGWPILYADQARVDHWARYSFPQFLRRRRRVSGGYFELRRLLAVSDPPRRIEVPCRLSDSLERVRASLGHPRLRSRWDRVRFTGVELLLYAIHCAETLRLHLGGETCRG